MLAIFISFGFGIVVLQLATVFWLNKRLRDIVQLHDPITARALDSVLRALPSKQQALQYRNRLRTLSDPEIARQLRSVDRADTILGYTFIALFAAALLLAAISAFLK